MFCDLRPFSMLLGDWENCDIGGVGAGGIHLYRVGFPLDPIFWLTVPLLLRPKFIKGQNLSSLVKSGQILSSLVKFGHVWSSLVKFGQIWSSVVKIC